MKTLVFLSFILPLIAYAQSDEMQWARHPSIQVNHVSGKDSDRPSVDVEIFTYMLPRVKPEWVSRLKLMGGGVRFKDESLAFICVGSINAATLEAGCEFVRLAYFTETSEVLLVGRPIRADESHQFKELRQFVQKKFAGVSGLSKNLVNRNFFNWSSRTTKVSQKAFWAIPSALAEVFIRPNTGRAYRFKDFDSEPRLDSSLARRQPPLTQYPRGVYEWPTDHSGEGEQPVEIREVVARMLLETPVDP